MNGETPEHKSDTIEKFDPSGVVCNSALFGLPFSLEQSEVVIIPMPWEVTVSYHASTASAPSKILDASSQVDLFVKGIPEAWKLGIFMLPLSEKMKGENIKYRALAAKYIEWLENGSADMSETELKIIPSIINGVCEKLNIYVSSLASKYLNAGKIVGLLGGDHSTPLGLMRVLGEKYGEFGILQIDAHADLRRAYENFKYSHASIMYNALRIKQVQRLVQVGVRDCCEDEIRIINNANGRVVTFFDDDLQAQLYQGDTWSEICMHIVSKLPAKVYLSFDIDGLDPRFCPNTGTPVPGGMDYNQALYLVKEVVKSGRKIIGFDLCEVGSDERSDWDANVGARLLYQISNLVAVSQRRLRFGH